MKPPWERYQWKGERRAGYRWRLLAHKDGAARGWVCSACGWKGSNPQKHPKSCEGDFVEHLSDSQSVELQSTDIPEPVCFDELVIDDWFHIEQMSDRHWWMRVGDLNLNIHVRADGTRTLSGWWDNENREPPANTGFAERPGHDQIEEAA